MARCDICGEDIDADCGLNCEQCGKLTCGDRNCIREDGQGCVDCDAEYGWLVKHY